MKKYIIKRILIFIPVLFMISIGAFLIVNLAPGNPVDMYVSPDMTVEQIQATKEALGLNDPLIVQYAKWVTNIMRGNLGFSFSSRIPVSTILFQRVGPTLLLMSISLVVAYVLAIPLGILSAKKQNSIVDYIVTGLSFTGISLPSFFLGLGLIYVFAVQLKWLPTGGTKLLGVDGGISDQIRHLILPVIVLASQFAANMIRYARASMIDVYNENYIRTAAAKGLKPMQILKNHGVRNALIPIITVIGADIPKVVGGAIVTEQIFQWPGIGSLMVASINSRDYPVLMAITMISAVAVLIANILVDIMYAVVDPRIKFS
jgi:peptide/nickel transport system permease protein